MGALHSILVMLNVRQWRRWRQCSRRIVVCLCATAHGTTFTAVLQFDRQMLVTRNGRARKSQVRSATLIAIASERQPVVSTDSRGGKLQVSRKTLSRICAESSLFLRSMPQPRSLNTDRPLAKSSTAMRAHTSESRLLARQRRDPTTSIAGTARRWLLYGPFLVHAHGVAALSNFNRVDICEPDNPLIDLILQHKPGIDLVPGGLIQRYTSV